MSHYRKFFYALLISSVLHLVLLVSLSGQYGALQGRQMFSGMRLIRVMHLGSRGARAMTVDQSDFVQESPEKKQPKKPEPVPAMNDRVLRDNSKDFQQERPSPQKRPSDSKDRFQPGNPQGQPPDTAEVSPEPEPEPEPEPVQPEPVEPPPPENLPARCASCPQPSYPGQAVQRRLEGDVVLRVQVLEDGRVGDIFVEKSSGFPILDEAAMSGAKGWTYYPAVENGEPIAAYHTATVRFSIAPR